MAEENPQLLFKKIISRANAAMPTLLNPAPNSPLLQELPQFLTPLEKHFRSGHTRDCLIAALYLLADDLHRSHMICQDIPTSYGSAWHAILHRREGDFSNSQYWWRRAASLRWDDLPANLRAAAAALVPPFHPPVRVADWLAAPAYDPSVFVDLIESHHNRPDAGSEAFFLAAQRLEWITLFAECWQLAETTT